MKTTISILIMLFAGLTGSSQTNQPKNFETDTYETSKGPLKITFIGHGTLMIEAGGQVVHIDPVLREADFSKLPKANLILVTHEHFDHLDKKAISMITNPQTKLIISKSCKGLIDNGTVLLNGEQKSFGDWGIEAVPAYNLLNKRPDGLPFHPKGNGNGYIISYGGKRIYVAGDTENVPEMGNLKNICIAFLPMNLPYTMTPEMVADGAKTFMPVILYPYHYGETNPQILVDLMKTTPTKVIIRKMK